jgi:hypothetical protein
MSTKVKSKKAAKLPAKEFDAVKMMRHIRKKIDKDIEGMTFEEQKAYIKAKLDKDNLHN